MATCTQCTRKFSTVAGLNKHISQIHSTGRKSEHLCIAIEPKLLAELDAMVKRFGTNRNSMISDAIASYLGYFAPELNHVTR